MTIAVGYTSKNSYKKQSTLDLLWTRMRQKGSLPGFSRAVCAITAALGGDDRHEFSIIKTVLSDPTLTQRVLALANSAMYAVFGQNINTVSRAVMVLGTDTIGHLALGLKLVEGLSSAASNSTQAQCEMEKAVLAGQIARQVAFSCQARDIEEAVVCAILHPLGRMVAVFYLPEYWSRIQEQCTALDASVSAVSMEILGLDLEELGRLSAQHWGLPQDVINSMMHVESRTRAQPLTHPEWLATVSTLSTGCARVLVYESKENRHDIARYAHDYAEMLGIRAEEIVEAVARGEKAARQELDMEQDLYEATVGLDTRAPEQMDLTLAVADLKVLAARSRGPHLTSMGLEVLLKGLQLSRVMLFSHQTARDTYQATLALGDNLPASQKPEFSTVYQPDVFHAAVANNKMILVADAGAVSFEDKLPLWWKRFSPGVHSFVVLPLVHQERCLGFLYGDWQKEKTERTVARADIAALEALRILMAGFLER